MERITYICSINPLNITNMPQKMTDEQMQNYISENRDKYLSTFPEDMREKKEEEINASETKKLYQKIHLRLSTEAKKQNPIYPHLQFIQKCNEEDLQTLKNAIESRAKTINNNRKKKAKDDIKKILDKYNKITGDTLTITYGE